MKQLETNQRIYLAEYCTKLSLVAATATVFGQFVPGVNVNWWVIVGGAFFTVIVIVFGTYLKKDTQKDIRI